LPLDLTPEADLAALAWLVELGADEAIGDEPVDRFAASARPAVAAPKPSPVAAPGPVRAAPPPGPDGTAALAAVCADLAALRAAMAGFEGSALRLGARNLVFADGNPAARLMVIGEAPGREEDRAGLPFVGPSGQLLDRMLAAIGLARHAEVAASAAYITNVLPWRPPQNREPSGDEAALLLPFLFRHIELAAPEVILLLGTPATRAVLGTEQGIMRMRGRWHDWRGIPAMATYHPAALLRDGAKKRDVWADLLLVKQRLEGGR
jgi:DNA polymerase